ncbi:roadblock/LC7 domain-containing protein [Streptomyces sp. NPDC001268]|uniref:roadblock/LC7 domain-containing protein n=1 Tax=Streptomyces sp. NPDC001268 TaxID=3364553 RepID=UPI0036CA4898
MTGAVTRLPDLGRMLRPLNDVPGGRHAVVVSEDGLRLGHAPAGDLTGPVALLGVPEAGALAAACAAMTMTMTGRSTAALLFGGGAGVGRLTPESEHGFGLFTRAGAGADVATGTDADVGPVAQLMQVLVARMGSHPGAGPRDPAPPPA